MEKKNSPLVCHITVIHNNGIDSFLEKLGFSTGMIAFAIPAYGILFRARAEGDPIALEFGAFFSLLEFVKTRLQHLDITSVQILSSNPEFVFSFTGKSGHILEHEDRKQLLLEYSKLYTISVGFVKTIDNRARVALPECASIPKHMKTPIKPSPSDLRKPEFRSFQRGTVF